MIGYKRSCSTGDDPWRYSQRYRPQLNNYSMVSVQTFVFPRGITVIVQVMVLPLGVELEMIQAEHTERQHTVQDLTSKQKLNKQK